MNIYSIYDFAVGFTPALTMLYVYIWALYTYFDANDIGNQSLFLAGGFTLVIAGVITYGVLRRLCRILDNPPTKSFPMIRKGLERGRDMIMLVGRFSVVVQIGHLVFTMIDQTEVIPKALSLLIGMLFALVPLRTMILFP